MTDNKSEQELIEQFFESQKYKEIINYYEEQENSCDNDDVVMSYIVESYTLSGEWEKAYLISNERIDRLEIKERINGLTEEEKEDFDIFINSKLEILLEKSRLVLFLINAFKYRKRIIDKMFFMKLINNALGVIRMRMFWGLMFLFLGYLCWVILELTKNIDERYGYYYNILFFLYLFFYFLIIPLGKYFNSKRFLN